MDKGEALIDFGKICRLCMTEETSMCSIFSEDTGIVPLPLRIMACVSIEVNAADALPNQICRTCLRQVDGWYKFKDLCENADATLRMLLSSEPVHFESIAQIQNAAQDVKKYFSMPCIGEPEDIGIQDTTSEEKKKLTRKCAKRRYVSETSVSKNVVTWPPEDTSNVDERLDDPADTEATAEIDSRDDSGVKKKRKLNYQDVTYDEPMPTKDGKVHQCRVCHKYLKNVTTRNRHELEKHPPPLPCEFCEKTFATVPTYHTHRNIHLGLTNYKCRFCGKYLASRSNLDDHEKVHTRERPVACPQCDKTFSSVSNLRVHLKFHAGIKTFFCHVCGKGHVTVGNLKLHVKRHLNERNHVCHICGKGFNGKSELNKHIDSHDVEKRYSCEYCFQKLKTPNSLRRHINIQHLKLKPHKCDVCHKEFGRRENLREHMQIHAVKKEFHCDVCARQFTHFRYLKKHKCE